MLLKIKICRTIILHVVLYGCETWSLASSEEHKLRVNSYIFGDITPLIQLKTNRRFRVTSPPLSGSRAKEETSVKQAGVMVGKP
jgi:hypothetical protein